MYGSTMHWWKSDIQGKSDVQYNKNNAFELTETNSNFPKI